MELGMSSIFFDELDCGDMVREFAAVGFTNIEISQKHTEELVEKKISADFIKFIESINFRITQGRLSVFDPGGILSADNIYVIDSLKRNLDLYLDLGVKVAVLRSRDCDGAEPGTERFERMVDTLKQLADYINGTGMSICFENTSCSLDYDAGRLLCLVKTVNNPHVGICLNTGRLNISQKGDPYHFVRQADSFLRALHINDNLGEHHGIAGEECDLRLLPFDRGNINWEGLKTGLREIDYQFLFCFDIGCRQYPIEVKRVTARYLRDMYEFFV